MPARGGIKYREYKKRNTSKCGGVLTDYIETEVKKEEKYNKVESNDGDNRRYIIRLMVDSVKNGKTEEEAIELAMNDKVAEKFEYLEKNGLNKKECFRNWLKGYLKSKDRKMPDFYIR